MPDQIPPLEYAPPALPAEESSPSPSQSTVVSEQQAARLQLVRQLIQLLGQNQGQLPMPQEQKLQPLLRQLIPLLTTGLPENPPPTDEPARIESGSLSQLIQKVIQQLPPGDPLLKTWLSTSQIKLVPSPSTTQLPAMLFEQTQALLNTMASPGNTDTGRALGIWILQLLTLRSPALARESTTTNTDLKNALLQQGVVLPEQAIITDKQAQARLLSLGRASLQFMTDLVQTSARQAPLAIAGVAKTPTGTETLSAPSTETQNKPADGAEEKPDTPPPLLTRVGERIIQLKTALFNPTSGEKVPAADKFPSAAALTSVADQPSAETLPITNPKESQSAQTQKHIPTDAKQVEQNKQAIKAVTSTSFAPHGALAPSAQPLPLNEFVHQLVQQQTRVPDPLRPLLQSLSAALQQPLTSEVDVQQWMAFLKAPLADSSVMGRNLRQWGATLLAIRFGQQGMLSATQQQHIGQQLSPNWLSLFGEENQRTLDKLTGQFLGQLERLQQQAGDPAQPLPNYVPLPTTHVERRESGLNQQSQRKENGSYQWSLNFSLDLGAQGAVQIKVNLDLPDIQMQMTAEKMSTVDRIKETLPLLEERFRQLGLCPSTLGCRQGKVSLTPMTEPSSSDGRLSIHI